MEVLDRIAAEIRAELNSRFNCDIAINEINLEPTRKPFSGDYSFLVFPLSKHLKGKTQEAVDLVFQLLVDLPYIRTVTTTGGFVNFIFADHVWIEQMEIGSKSLNQKDSSRGQILVEYASPNTNKPLHLGHLRNIFLGHSVSLIRAKAGYDVVKTQVINDRGVHICKSMLAWKMHGNNETPYTSGLKGDKLVGAYYVLYDKHFKAQVDKLMKDGMSEEDAKKAAPLTSKVQDMLVKWENNDPEVRQLWATMNGWVYEGFDATYNRMGVTFDKVYYESDTYAIGKQIVLDALEKKHNGFYKKEDGSVWADLKAEGLDDKLLIRGDGTTVYMTQDIGTAVLRFQDYPKLDQIIYTVGDEQDYHFKVLFLILEKLGYAWAKNCRHLSYGMVDLPSGRMKSREGTVVDADDLMKEVVEAARKASEEKGKLDELSEAEQHDLYEMLGIGALKYYLLRVEPKKRMLFNPEESVSLNGDTGPFIQYTHARCKSVLRKAGEISISEPTSIEEKERALIRSLSLFPTMVERASAEMSPAMLANYALDVAKLYNQFYHDTPILKAEEPQRSFRIALTQQTAETLKNAMGLLGIRVPERM